MDVQHRSGSYYLVPAGLEVIVSMIAFLVKHLRCVEGDSEVTALAGCFRPLELEGLIIYLRDGRRLVDGLALTCQLHILGKGAFYYRLGELDGHIVDGFHQHFFWQAFDAFHEENYLRTWREHYCVVLTAAVTELVGYMDAVFV